MTATTLTISKDSDVITFINLFTVQSEEEQQQLIDLLIKATEEVMCNQEGFVSANIHKSLDGKHVVNYEQWKNKESFEKMLRNTKALIHMDKVLKVTKEVEGYYLYNVVYTNEHQKQ
jgi:quinol monooxygenase YgiN